jgi:predicted Zn-dependent protease
MPEPRLALVNFLWQSGRRDEAEAELKEVLKLDAKNASANRALATFYVATGRAAEAEPYLKIVAESSQQPGPKLQLADYYITLRRFADASNVLKPLTLQQAAFVPARLRLASIRYDEGLRQEAYQVLEEVLQKEPRNVPALTLKGRMQLGEGRSQDAVKTLQQAVALEPTSAPAQ